MQDLASLKTYSIDQQWERQSPSPLSIIDVAIRAEPVTDCQAQGLGGADLLLLQQITDQMGTGPLTAYLVHHSE